MFTLLGILGLALVAQAPANAANLEPVTYADPNPADPFFTLVWPGQLTTASETRKRLGLTGPLRVAFVRATITLPNSTAIVSTIQAPGRCEGIGQPHDLIPRIQRCTAKLALITGAGYTITETPAICLIYNQDGTPADRASVDYDAATNSLRFSAQLNGKGVPECDTTLPLITAK